MPDAPSRGWSRVHRPKSEAAFARALAVTPGGVNSPARAFGAVGGHPLFIAHAAGAHLTDLDGHQYLDFIGSWGPMILGHAHPAVLAAAGNAMQHGTSYGAPTERETELAELVADCVPSIEMVRFTSSGTEAAMSAVRLCRGATGRDLVIKFAGCYHGHVDALLVSAGSSALTLGTPDSPGIPRSVTENTRVLPFNDCESLREAFTEFGDQIAGVMLEPVVGNMGLVKPTEEFRKELRRLTQHYGSILIYDEVMTGFRLSLGGAQGLLNDEPDVTALGKIIGGGYPVGAYAGRREILKHVMPAGRVFQAGTLSGNPVAMAAGLATLTELRNHPPYDYLERLGQAVETGLTAAAREVGLPHQFNRVGSMWTLFFSSTPVTDYRSAITSDTQRYAQWFWAMMDRGFYLPCSQYEAAFLSAAMTEAQIAEFVVAAQDALREVAATAAKSPVR